MDITGSVTAAVAATSFIALGPIAFGQRLKLLNFRLDGTFAGTVPLAFAICGSPALNQANLESGLSLIQTSSTQIGRVPAIPIFLKSATHVTWSLTLDRIIESGPRWLLTAIVNNDATLKPELSINLLTDNARVPFGPGSTSPADRPTNNDPTTSPTTQRRLPPPLGTSPSK